MPNEDLIKAYKKSRALIKDEPKNKETIINEFIDLVVKINTYDTSSKSISSTNNELRYLFKNPIEIAIYNNFQRNNDDNDLNTNATNAINLKDNSMKYLASIYDEKNKK
jgi:hypothetical protein